MREEFVYPDIRMGMFVEVSNDPSRSDRMLGIVIDPKNECADICTITRTGLGMRRNCWYEGDPRCDHELEHFHRNQSGVFNIAPRELEIIHLREDLDKLTQELEEAKAREAVKPLRKQDPPQIAEAADLPAPKRKGRPPKSTRPEPVIAQ